MTIASSQQFIVEEISKNWIDGVAVVDSGLISEQFEHIVNVNDARGYRLLTFTLHRLMAMEGAMNETIIAVFEKKVTT